ncbi:MAG: hypothetical protein F6K47_08275 [Symploca sp. SIO2E6]|nr:hypothetical protein [Symploca sp. SIO2E6]
MLFVVCCLLFGNWELGIGNWELGMGIGNGNWECLPVSLVSPSPLSSLSPHPLISPSPHLPIRRITLPAQPILVLFALR